MFQARINMAFARLDLLELRFCRPCNAAARTLPVRRYFALVSRLGDGMAWYTLLLLLPMSGGGPALLASLHMAATALVGLLIYKLLKSRLVRKRPCMSRDGTEALTAPLDRYSFPSGHTLHAVCFTIMLAHYLPALLWLLIPFALSIALSRVILGLHYPSDVAAGALLGWLIAELSLLARLPPL